MATSTASHERGSLTSGLVAPESPSYHRLESKLQQIGDRIMRFTSILVVMFLAACALIPSRAPAEPEKPANQPKAKATHFEGLGMHTRTVATNNPEAQKFFNQGLNFMFAVDHDEAVRGF